MRGKRKGESRMKDDRKAGRRRQMEDERKAERRRQNEG
jgi:hypothetical protein